MKNGKLSNLIPISEIFYSIQGEGKYAGNPSIFIRVGGCNLKCPSFGKNGCDSFYAVDKKYQKEWQNLSIEEIKSEIEKYLKFRPDLIITGGEPGLYFDKLYPLIKWFEGDITIETNTTISPDFTEYPLYKKVSFAMSVKLSNSGEEYQRRVKKEVIKNIAKNAHKSFFKFVIDRDLKDEIEEITENIKLPIYCMPLGENREELEKNAPFVFNFCLENGYRYSDRIHIRLFGKKRGV